MKQPISKVYHGDCMDFMRDLPGGYFDLVLADPPYGIKQDGRNNHTRGGFTMFNGVKSKAKAKDYRGRGQYDSKSPDKSVFDEIRRMSKNQIFFGANHYIDKIPYPSPCWIIWDKMNGPNDFADAELAWTSFDSAIRIFQFKWHGMLQGDMANKENRIHPNHKPIPLYKWLLTNYAKPGQRIFDPMMGSQSSRIAAWDMGFDYWGAEKDDDYFRDGCARFEAHIKKPVLFAPEQMYNFEQAKLFE